MKKGEHIYSGKGKSIFATDNKSQVIMHFRDDLTAFNGEKKDVCEGKGIFNNHINAFLMKKLADAGINVGFIELLNNRETLVRRLEMIKLEFVMRNIAAGTITKRLGLNKGTTLQPAVQELFLKDDDLGDPFINISHVKTLKLADIDIVDQAEKITMQVNMVLKDVFSNVGIDLVDFKLEFGMADGKLYVGDEISADSCRLWEQNTKRPFDKDLFRFDLGDIATSYKSLTEMLGIEIIDSDTDV